MASLRVKSPPREAELTGSRISGTALPAAIVLVTLAAAALRLYRLGEWSFWVDEMFTLQDSLDPAERFHGMTYPLSYIVIGASMYAFGVGEWSARIVPALFGIAAPATIYLLARRSFGDLPSIIAAGVVAISPWHIYWSQMARFYTMTLLFSTASVLLLHRGLEENRRSLVAAAGLMIVAAMLSHYSAALALAAVVVYAALLRIVRWQKPPGLNLANALIFLSPLILAAALVGTRAGSLLATYAAGQPTGTTFANPLVGGVYIVFSTGYRLEPVVVLLGLVGAWQGVSRRDRGALLLTCAVVVPVLLLVVSGMMSHAENRYGFIVLPMAALLAGSSLRTICRILWPASRVLAFVVPLAIAIPILQRDAVYFGPASNGERWNYRAAAEFLRSNARPNDAIYSAMPMPLAHYLRDTGLTIRDLDVGTDAGELIAGRAWFVIEDATRGESVPRQLAGWLEKNCRLAAHFPASSPVTNYGLSVYVSAPNDETGSALSSYPVAPLATLPGR